MSAEEELRKLIQTRLMREREKAELSQTELSRLSGLSLSYIKRIETGGSVPTIITTWRYLTACKKTLGDFFIYWLPSGPDLRSSRNRAIHQQIDRLLQTPLGVQHVENMLAMLDHLLT